MLVFKIMISTHAESRLIRIYFYKILLQKIYENALLSLRNPMTINYTIKDYEF